MVVVASPVNLFFSRKRKTPALVAIACVYVSGVAIINNEAMNNKIFVETCV